MPWIAACGADPSEQNPCLHPDGRLLTTRFEGGYNEGPSDLVLDGEILLGDGDHDFVNLPGRCFDTEGERLVYSSDAEERDEIWSLDLGSGEASRLTDLPGQHSYEPAFDHTGEQVVFESSGEERAGRIWRVPAAGGPAEALTDGSSDDREPNPSPSEDLVVFQSDAEGTFGLWTLRLAGGPAAVLLDTAAEETDPSYLPDGSGVVFATDDCAGLSCIGLLQGGIVTLLHGEAGWYWGAPAVAPDGTVWAEGCEGDPEEGTPTEVRAVAVVDLGGRR